jgi:hypothetical protein
LEELVNQRLLSPLGVARIPVTSLSTTC